MKLVLAFGVIFLAGVARAELFVQHSLEWLADTSEVVAIYAAESVQLRSENHHFPPGREKTDVDLFDSVFLLRLRRLEAWKGDAPATLEPQPYYSRTAGRVEEGTWPVAGDQFLVFLELQRYPPGNARQLDARVRRLIHLRAPLHGDFSNRAVAANLGQLANGADIERLVRARLAAQPGSGTKRGEGEAAGMSFTVNFTPMDESWGFSGFRGLDLMVPADLRPPPALVERWKTYRGSANSTTLDVRITPWVTALAVESRGDGTGSVLLTVRIENRSERTLTALVPPESGGILWGTTSLQAHAKRAGKAPGQAPAFALFQPGKSDAWPEVEWQPGQSRDVVLRWRGWDGLPAWMIGAPNFELEAGVHALSLTLDFLVDGALERASSPEIPLQVSVRLAEPPPRRELSRRPAETPLVVPPEQTLESTAAPTPGVRIVVDDPGERLPTLEWLAATSPSVGLYEITSAQPVQETRYPATTPTGKDRLVRQDRLGLRLLAAWKGEPPSATGADPETTQLGAPNAGALPRVGDRALVFLKPVRHDGNRERVAHASLLRAPSIHDRRGFALTARFEVLGDGATIEALVRARLRGFPSFEALEWNEVGNGPTAEVPRESPIRGIYGLRPKCSLLLPKESSIP